MTQASQPGNKKGGVKGLLFIISGILCINFQETVGMVNSFLSHVITMSITLKRSQGF
jgi:hypothetical protein